VTEANAGEGGRLPEGVRKEVSKRVSVTKGGVRLTQSQSPGHSPFEKWERWRGEKRLVTSS